MLPRQNWRYRSVGYYVDLQWLEENQLSFATLVERCLCSRHQALARKKPEAVLATIARCCSQDEGYLSQRLPLLESIFRLVLAKGNQPVSAEALAAELALRRGESLDGAKVARLLASEPRYYGLRATPEPEAEAEAEAEPSPPPAQG